LTNLRECQKISAKWGGDAKVWYAMVYYGMVWYGKVW